MVMLWSKTIVIVFIWFAAIEIYGQSIDVLLAQYMNDVRTSSSSATIDIFLKEENSKAVLNAIQIYYSDSLPKVRSKAYEITGRVGLKSGNPDIRQWGTTQLTSFHNDPDAGNVGQLWSLLSKFKKEDFALIAKDSLKSSFRQKQPHLDQLMKLVGYLQMTDMKEEIRPLTLPPTNKRDRWAALLALSRMGDEVAIQSVVQRAQKLKVNDDVVFEVFPDLMYTRQMEAINIMITVLNSDEKNCFAADAENETRIPCAYRVMEQLASIVEDYPLQVDASGDIITKDYVKTLSDVRKWFQKNGSNYKINKESF